MNTKDKKEFFELLMKELQRRLRDYNKEATEITDLSVDLNYDKKNELLHRQLELYSVLNFIYKNEN